MSNIAFPYPATTGQTFIASTGVVYFYDGIKWVAQGQGGGGLPNGPVNSLQFNAGNGQLGGVSNVTTDGTNVSVSGNVHATTFYGCGSHLTGISGGGNSISNGCSAVFIASGNANVIVAIDGQPSLAFGVCGTIMGLSGTGNTSGATSEINLLCREVRINPTANIPCLAWTFTNFGNSSCTSNNVSVLRAPASNSANIGGLYMPACGSSGGLITWLDENSYANTLLIASGNTVSISTEFGMGFGCSANAWQFDPHGNITVPGGMIVGNQGNASAFGITVPAILVFPLVPTQVFVVALAITLGHLPPTAV